MTKIKSKFNILTKQQKIEISKRKEICINCVFNSKNAEEAGIYINKTKRIDLHCSICECNIDLFTACLACNCSIEEYNEKYKTKIPLNWVAIK